MLSTFCHYADIWFVFAAIFFLLMFFLLIFCLKYVIFVTDSYIDIFFVSKLVQMSRFSSFDYFWLFDFWVLFQGCQSCMKLVLGNTYIQEVHFLKGYLESLHHLILLVGYLMIIVLILWLFCESFSQWVVCC